MEGDSEGTGLLGRSLETYAFWGKLGGKGATAKVDWILY